MSTAIQIDSRREALSDQSNRERCTDRLSSQRVYQGLSANGYNSRRNSSSSRQVKWISCFLQSVVQMHK